METAGTTNRNRYPITDVNGLILVDIIDILYLLTARNYTNFKMADGTGHTQSQCMAEHLRALGPGFCRISRSCAVNLDHAVRLENSGVLHLAGGITLNVESKYFLSARHAMALN